MRLRASERWRSRTSIGSTILPCAAWMGRQGGPWWPRSTHCERPTSRSAESSRFRFSGSSRARLAHILGGALGRTPRDGDSLDPGDEGRIGRRWVSDRRRAGLTGPRRDLLLRAAWLLSRDKPLGWSGG